MPENRRTASIRPSSFTSDAGLLDMSMEQVVSMMLDKEKHRHKESRDNENEQEVVVTAKVMPLGLIASLTLAAHKSGISRSLLTRCISHQIAAWYDCLPGVAELTNDFYEGYQLALDYGQPDLCKRVQSVQYSFGSSEDTITSFRSIAWVQNKLSNLSLPLGIKPGVLFVIGLCYSLSVSESESLTKQNFIAKEVTRFGTLVGERRIDIARFKELVQYRIENLKT